MAKRSSKKTRRATKRPSTKRVAPSRPAEVAKYALGKEIGRGGLGRVVEAVDAEIGRTVALKLLLEGAPLDVVERFKREGRITGRLEHPNIVPVHEVGHLPGEKGTRGEIYFAMKKIAGRDLADALKEFRAGKGGWTQRRLVEIFRDVCRAMAFAHSKGVIHRDIKPSNVMVGEFGEVLVVDWGLAKVVGSRETGVGSKAPRDESAPLLTLDGDIFGTPDYMSPEQADGRIDQIDERSDVFSLGAVLYEILAGRPPFAGGTTTEILRRVIEGNPTRPTDLLKTLDPAGRASPTSPLQPLPAFVTVPPELEAVCLKALASAKADRYASASALVDDIQRFLDGALERERRERLATEQVARTRAEIERWERRGREAREIRARAKAEEKALQPHSPRPARREQWRLEDEAAAAERESVEAYSEAIAAVTSALSNVPAHAEARQLRARLAWEKFAEAEEAADRNGMILHRRVVEQHNDGAFDAQLRGDGSLAVRTRAYPCRCLRDGRDVPPDDLNVLGYHPWTGQRLDGGGLDALPELATNGPVRLRVHSLQCRPEPLAGARVWAFRYEESDRLLVPVTPPGAAGEPVPAEALDALWGDSPFRPRGPGLFLGRTPVARRAWPMGSWLLVIVADGRFPQRVPFHVARLQEVDLDLTLLTPEEIPEGFVFVCAGPFLFQGERQTALSMSGATRVLDDVFIARHPVTSREYAAWLNTLRARDAAAAARRVPRAMNDKPYWPCVEGEGYAVPTPERLAAWPEEVRGRASKLSYTEASWADDWPVLGISWEDGQHFARSTSLERGWLLHLPHEEQWEKAARGADGRSWPWGNAFDQGLGNYNESHPEGMRPVEVTRFPTDESPWGARGMGGNATQWCLNELGDRFRAYRIGRGGQWNAGKSASFTAHRLGAMLRRVNHCATFRLAAAIRPSAERKAVTY